MPSSSSRYCLDDAEVEVTSAGEEEEDDDTASQTRDQARNGSSGGRTGSQQPLGESGEDADEMEEDTQGPRRRNPTTAEDRRAQNEAAIEGVAGEARQFLTPLGRSQMHWRGDKDRYIQTDIPDEWVPWGRVPDASDGHLKLREEWLSWMACTSKLLQTVDNKHLNRHLDYMYTGPTINFVDLQTTPQLGRRLEILAHLVECMNNYGEFPLDCVVPTKETEIVIGSNRGGKLVRGMRMKNPGKKVQRKVDLVSGQDARAAERWLKDFERGRIVVYWHTIHHTIHHTTHHLKCH